MTARRFVRLLPLLVVAGFVPFVDLLFAAPQERKPRKVAFLVGVGKFQHDLPNLKGAPQQDADALETELRKNGFEVVKLTDERATKKEVEAQFRKLLDGGGDSSKALGQGDVLLVALCSHGFTFEITNPATKAKTSEPFVAGYDAVPGEGGNMIGLNALIETAKPFGATKLFLVDACREVPPDVNRGVTRGIEGTQMSLPKRTAVLFACGQGELSHQPDKADGHGLFTFAVLKTLKGGGRVTWSGLVHGVENAFDSAAFKAMLPKGESQIPVLATGELGATELFAAKAGTPPGDMAKRDLLPGEKEEPFDYIVNDAEKKSGMHRVLTVDVGGEKMEFVRIEGNEFLMGAPEGEKGADDNEQPQRKVKLSTFYLGKFEVTQAQYKAITGKSPSHFKGDRLPVEQVSWDDAVAFCELASKKTSGGKLSLPSEAQWEFACRAGTTTPFHFGSKLSGDHANHDGNSPYGTDAEGGKYHAKTVDVGSYKANPWGLHDMHGNVYEWCADYYGKYNRVAANVNPLQDIKQSNDSRVVRGGSWSFSARHCRAADRNGYAPVVRFDLSGFRLCFRLDF